MKRSLLYLLILCLVSCAGEIEDRYLSIEDSSMSDNWIFDAADNAFREFYPAKSRANSLSNKRLAVVTNQISRSEDPDTILNIVNYADNEGFVVIDNHKKEILAVSDNGEVIPGEIENPGMQIFLNSALEYATKDSLILADTLNVTDQRIYDILNKPVEPRCPYNWGQEHPAGLACPNKISGCAPLALSMILAYYERPDSMTTVLYPGGSPVIRFFDWENMKKNVFSERYSEHKPTIFVKDPEYRAMMDLAYLCNEIGHRTESLYLDNETRTTLHNLYTLAQKLDSTLYVSKLVGYKPKAWREISDDGVIFASAYDVSQNPAINHCWIIDGYKTKCSVLKNPESHTGITLSVVEYQHINWGWYGECNGYFKSGVFDMADAYEYDNPCKDNSHTWNYNNTFMYFTIKKRL